MNRIALTILAATIGGVVPAAAQNADTFPERPIRLIVPFPAGSSTDVVGRIVAQRLGDKLGQQLVVENRAGASGALGADATAKATPDGYTIGLITASTHGVNPAFNNKLIYDPIKDFKPVSMIGGGPYVFVVNPGLPIKSIKDLIDLAKAKPGELNYGSAGLASLAYLGTAQFTSQMGIELTHVPYKSTSQSSIDLITGRLNMQMASIAPVRANVLDGQLRAIATTGRTRVAALPDVPTMIESGVDNYELSLWMAFVMPAATPDPIVAKVNKAMTEVLSAKETQDTLNTHGFTTEPGPPETVTQRIQGDIKKWKDLAAKTGLQIH